MRRYWLHTYAVQVTAVLLMLLALPLRWHTEHGTGLELLELALITKIPFGLDPFDPDYISVSQWWIVWNVFFTAGVLGLRAAIGFIFVRLEGQRKLVAVTILLMLISMGWYIAANYRGLRFGFSLEMVSVAVLVAAVIFEMLLPEKSSEARRLDALPPNHPDRITQGHYRICPICGEFNDFEAKNCRECNSVLYPDPRIM